MGLVHALVAEVLCKFIDSVESADNESFEVQLVGNSEVQRNIQSVVVGDERSGGGTSRDALKNRCLHLKTSGGVEVFSHGGNNLRSLDEYVLYLRIYDKIHISLAITQLRVCKCIENLAVKLFYNRKNFQGLAEQGEFLGMYAQLSGLGDECESADADDVTYVQKLFPNGVVHGLVFTGTDFVSFDVNLNSSCLILNLSE